MYEKYKAVRLHPLSHAVALALASLVASHAAVAQDAGTAAAPAAPAAQGNDATTGVQTVTIVATRRSQQSSIARKKNAATAIDSIVAEDVGALPDRNIGEAISRMAGVSLDRGDFGEGVSVAIRGNGPELTRVELDGMAVQSAGGTDLNGGGSGRGTEFRNLSADLIKSVDIVKGSTADQVEGSLGGGIQITTRNGLDFSKPFASLRVAATQNSLNKKWEPDMNLILSRKFMDNRLGVILNTSQSTTANEMHQQQVATSSNQGYARAVDFDNSPEKTFTYNPATVNTADAASNQPAFAAVGPFTFMTPLDIVTKSANAKTKADCYAAFPTYNINSGAAGSTAANAAGFAALSSGNKTTVINNSQYQLQSCLNQWNDYTPSLIRYRIQRQVERKKNLDLRADFKVNSELTVYAKGAYSKYTIDNNSALLELGNLAVNSNTNFFTDTLPNSAGAGARRNLTPTGIANGQFVNEFTPTITANGLMPNSITNVDPKSVTVDASHHVTQMTINNAAAGINYLHDTAKTTTRVFQTGGTWNHGPLKLEFLLGDVKSDFQREGKRTDIAQYYGTSTMSVLPNGLWTYSFPANSTYDLYKAAPYAILAAPVATAATAASASVVKAIPAYTAAQNPNLTYSQPQLTYNGQIRATEERNAKLDLTYAVGDRIPFLTRIKSGFNMRDYFVRGYTGGGYTVNSSGNPQIIVPSGNIRSRLFGCQDTAGSLAAGGNKCVLGLVPSNGYSTALSNNVYVTPAALADIIGQSFNGNMTSTGFMNGVSGYSGVVSNWPNLNVDKLFALSGVPNANLDCIVECKANDGKTYPQPYSKLKERVQAAYLMTDFNIDRFPFTDKALPFGWELEGNIGYRLVKTKVNGTGNMTFRSITRAATFDTNGAVNDVSVTGPTSIQSETTDRLPSLNAAVWVIPDKVVLRYSGAKTIARPRAERLLAQGTCTYDERFALDVDQRCSGTIGNPGLLPQKNVNQNLSAEYYPSKDTMVTLSYFVQHGIIGPELAQTTTGGSIGAGLVDPVTGKDLGSIPFDYSIWQNGVANTRKGWEFSTKTAFTFLPSILRYTGFDGNYTKLASVTSTRAFVDLLSGVALPPYRESTFQYNWAVWYDDGKLNARIAVQSASPYFTAIAADGANTVNNYPNASGQTRPPPYNPGSPNFRDKTRYVDAKISYKFSPNLEIFAEARNLTNKTFSNSQGSFVPFSNGTPSLLDYSFTGRRVMAGLNFRYGG